MGSRVQKIAFLIFALMFVAIMAILNTSILTLGTSANGQLTSVVSSDDSSLSVYDQGSVYGTQVVNCAKDPAAVGSTVEKVFVITAADTAGVDYNETSGAYNASTAASPGSGETVINTTAKFNSYLCYNTNGICTGVMFIQQGSFPTTSDAASAAATLADGLTVQGLN